MMSPSSSPTSRIGNESREGGERLILGVVIPAPAPMPAHTNGVPGLSTSSPDSNDEASPSPSTTPFPCENTAPPLFLLRNRANGEGAFFMVKATARTLRTSSVTMQELAVVVVL